MSNPSPGWYTVNATDGNTFLEDSIFVEVLPSASLSLNTSGYQLVCEQDWPQALAAEGSGGLPVQWYVDDAPSTVGPIFNANEPGNYYATVTNVFGCTTTSDEIELTTAPSPALECAEPYAYLSISDVVLTESNSVIWQLPEGSELAGVTSILVESAGRME